MCWNGWRSDNYNWIVGDAFMKREVELSEHFATKEKGDVLTLASGLASRLVARKVAKYTKEEKDKMAKQQETAKKASKSRAEGRARQEKAKAKSKENAIKKRTEEEKLLEDK